MLRVDMVYLLVTGKTKTEIKAMWHDLSSYAALTKSLGKILKKYLYKNKLHSFLEKL